jgi:hypothetical protein
VVSFLVTIYSSSVSNVHKPQVKLEHGRIEIFVDWKACSVSITNTDTTMTLYV